MNGWIAAAAVWLACALAVWAWWAVERRTARPYNPAAEAGSRSRHPGARPAVSWLCPFCKDAVHGRDLAEVDAGSKEHMRVCAFYRISGSWEAVQ